LGILFVNALVLEGSVGMINRLSFRSGRFSAACALILGCVISSAAGAQDSSTKTAAAGPHKHAATTKASASSKKHRRKKSSRVRGQQKIDAERALAIQQALVREHYLKGTPTGTWNQASEEAMRRYQADNGWQSKTVPDSRALIKLGLGPSKDHLLNPESAMTTVPDAPKAQPMPPTSHSAVPSADPVPAPAATPSTPATNSSSPATATPSGPQRKFEY
jgi:hypothetical protein